MENLIENALHYTPRGGTIVIEMLLCEEVEILVSDTGPGIDQKELEHIFERFYHIEKSRTDKDLTNTGGHSGLGLAITKKIIELHGRTITVKSKIGYGSCFSFTLPIAVS